MPHCLLEYSRNIIDQPDFKRLLKDINELLAGTGLFRLSDIKSRVIAHDQYVIGDGAENRTFVAMTISILDGRDAAVKKNISSLVIKLLEQYFVRTLAETRCSLSVRISDIDRESYDKTVSYET